MAMHDRMHPMGLWRVDVRSGDVWRVRVFEHEDDAVRCYRDASADLAASVRERRASEGETVLTGPDGRLLVRWSVRGPLAS